MGFFLTISCNYEIPGDKYLKIKALSNCDIQKTVSRPRPSQQECVWSEKTNQPSSTANVTQPVQQSAQRSTPAHH